MNLFLKVILTCFKVIACKKRLQHYIRNRLHILFLPASLRVHHWSYRTFLLRWFWRKVFAIQWSCHISAVRKRLQYCAIRGWPFRYSHSYLLYLVDTILSISHCVLLTLWKIGTIKTSQFGRLMLFKTIRIPVSSQFFWLPYMLLRQRCITLESDMDYLWLSFPFLWYIRASASSWGNSFCLELYCLLLVD